MLKKFKKRFEELEDIDTYVDPEIIRAYTGKSDGVQNVFDHDK